jgi:hypothetical protein
MERILQRVHGHKSMGVIYKLAAGRNSSNTQISTLLKPDGTLTADIKETLTLMIDSFAPKDNNEEDTEHQKQIRTLPKQPANTKNDREFTIEEVSNTIESMNNYKAPGEDGITSVIYYQVFKKVQHSSRQYTTAA